MFDAFDRSLAPPRWGLRRVKRIYTDLVDEFSRGELSHALEGPLSPYPGSVRSPGKLLRMWLRSPWNDYTLIGSGSVEPSLVSCQGKYFSRATIREFPNPGSMELLQALSEIEHPNIAAIYDVYCYGNKISIASEYLELSLADTSFLSFPFDEWEVATIITEVLNGSGYLLLRGISCKELSMSDIRISTEGKIKIVLDLAQYGRKASDESTRFAHALLDLPFIAQIVEEMLLLRYEQEEWPESVMDFLSCCLTGSIQSLMRHPFLANAKSAIKLSPRVRFAIEASRLDLLNLNEESISGRFDGT
ncbi:uncharacterized protein RCO7_11237 [Rhynchosporium graminicola]|uniref:Protein kinase domain-containing protein n=1 Tax=Rhynchosporium graminicola TaxID=2792576 RepID=A0A1E1LB78_9HELO|nr:uncharacterized protein RCO7_11237 [Rhynchosporium commune]